MPNFMHKLFYLVALNYFYQMKSVSDKEDIKMRYLLHKYEIQLSPERIDL